ncbi:MAG: CDP-alcohol phosphatidyltransferase family protein [Clostridia bacterium]|nr:CDP-alcohol phosphatidyltransferase family protein [Clostridia bacterium]
MVKELFKNWKTVPNLLSFIRILLVPVFGYLFYTDKLLAALIVLAVSGLSDMFDGKIARRFNQVSELGKILDPIADKATQITLAVILLLKFRASDNSTIRAFGLVFLVFLIKEGVMLVGGAVMIALGIKPGAAEIFGKIATVVFYAVTIVIFAIGPDVGALCGYLNGWALPEVVTGILVVISAIMTLTAFASYMPETYRQFKERFSKNK